MAYKLVVLLDGPATAPDQVSYLRDVAGYQVVQLNPRLGRTQVRSKLSLALTTVLPRIDLYRTALKDADAVVVYNWYFLTLLVLQKLHIVRRPRLILSVGMFIQSEKFTKVAFGLARRLTSGNEWFAASSEQHRQQAITMIGLPPERCVMWPYRFSDGLPAKHGPEEGYVFTGGYTNRDYDTFLKAVHDLDTRVVIQALPGNEFPADIPSHIEIDTRFGPDLFEQLLGASSLVVLPLLPYGTSSGQSVLLQALQYGKPTLVTRHAGITELLDDDYPGYLEPQDLEGMTTAIRRALHDESFRSELAAAARTAQEKINAWVPLHTEITNLVERSRSSS